MTIERPEELLLQIVKILNKLEIPYIITGGFAVAVLAKPRFTADIDIIVKIKPKNILELTKELLAIDKNAYISQEAMRDAIKNNGEFNFIHPGTGLKVDFWLKRYPFEEFKKSIVKKINGQKINFISPEDLILSKLIWYKEGQGSKQLEDIRSILKIAKPDLNYIKAWAAKTSTSEILEEILKNNK
ncbi:MAG: nucleotidyl transferase AbiEii/AbiGii toxin family protein [Candidatus Nealsonbacteria bacterium]